MITNGRSPYPGLRAYNRDESDLFFGREGCIDEMAGRLAATRFLAGLGASGSGQSSLVRMGLLDASEWGCTAQVGCPRLNWVFTRGPGPVGSVRTCIRAVTRCKTWRSVCYEHAGMNTPRQSMSPF